MVSAHGPLAGAAVPPLPAGWISVRDFGVAGAGLADDSRGVQAAYDAVAAAGGGWLYFPPGIYRLSLILYSRAVHLIGAGETVTKIYSLSDTRPALEPMYRNGAIAPVMIWYIGFIGSSLSSTLVRIGGENYSRDAEYSGGNHFFGCSFKSAKIAIERKFGSIDLLVESCRFSDCDYCIHVTTPDIKTPAAAMHGGVMTVRGSWFQSFRRALLYLASPTEGSGSVIFERNIAELASGFVFYIDGFSGSRAPAIVIRDQWNEATATAVSVSIADDGDSKPAFLFARNARPAILIENSAVGAVRLQNSSVVTRSCDLTDCQYDGAADSSLFHDEAFALEGVVPGITRSLAPPIQGGEIRSAWFTMPSPTTRSSVFRNHLLYLFDGRGPFNLSGSRRLTPKVAETTSPLSSPSDVRRFMIDPSDRLFPQPFPTIPAARFLVIRILARALKGEAIVQINGPQGVGGGGVIKGADWAAWTALIMPIPREIANNSIHFISAGGAEIEVAGIAILAPSTLASAIECANAREFPSRHPT